VADICRTDPPRQWARTSRGGEFSQHPERRRQEKPPQHERGMWLEEHAEREGEYDDRGEYEKACEGTRPTGGEIEQVPCGVAASAPDPLKRIELEFYENWHRVQF